ncbi:MAG: hypothetical protein ACYTF1_05815 [Planctomycetota bacterium]|jgi:hypothetical protein
MGFISRFFGHKQKKGESEHAVVIHFEYGSTDLSRLFELGDKLESAIAEAGVGEFDGNEVATDGSDGFLYMYGPEKSRLAYKKSLQLCRWDSARRNVRLRSLP